MKEGKLAPLILALIFALWAFTLAITGVGTP
jgi:hypothetical protein